MPRGTKVRWLTEPNKELGSFQPLLKVGYSTNFTLSLKDGDGMETFKVIEILVGSSDPERQGLSLKRLKRLLAPQSQENPIYFHMTNGSSQGVTKMRNPANPCKTEKKLYQTNKIFGLSQAICYFKFKLKPSWNESQEIFQKINSILAIQIIFGK